MAAETGLPTAPAVPQMKRPARRPPAVSHAVDDSLPPARRRTSLSPASQPPGWARAVLRAAGAASADNQTPRVEAVPGARLRRGDVVRAAVRVVRAGQASPSVLMNERVPAALASLLADDLFRAPADRIAAIAAMHVVSSAAPHREALVTAGALPALVRVANEAEAARSLRPDAPRGPVWNPAVRTIAKLVVCATSACAAAIPSGALALLAHAALPEEDVDVRVRAAAGLAAIAAWSGPRSAVKIVETPHVVRAMSALLTGRDGMISNHLRSATMDGLVAMSFHRRARRILREHGCEGKVTEAAKHASMSGDYDIAARGTVAAGKLTGRSVDEFGFFVEGSSESQDAAEDEAAVASKDSTGLKHIQEMLVHEAFMQVEEKSALEMIVAEDAGSGSSSPRERQLVRDAARMYGVDAEAVVRKLPLERAGSPTSPTDSSSRKTSREDSPKKGALEIPEVKALRSSPSSSRVSSRRSSPRVRSRPASKNDAVETIEIVPSHVSPASSGKSNKSKEQEEEDVAVKRTSSDVVDPDDEPEPVLETLENSGDDAASSMKRVRMSPLMMFSMGTKKAAELDNANAQMRKSASQLNRDVEYERIWADVLENHPEWLQRGEGAMRRVQAYRNLATVPVPPALRRKLWPVLLEVDELRARQPGLYAALCKVGEERALSDETEHTISADVTRTMPHHALFWSGGAQVGVQSLRSILRAYARHRPEVGYCQGMSSVAAVFMMNARDEEDAFLMFVQFMEKFQYKQVFAEGFPQMLEWLEEIRPLVYHYMPELWHRLDKEGVPLELYADKWLITALSHNFPHRYLLRIWDLMFLGGSPKIILKSCLAVMKSCESQLMTMEFEGMLGLLQREFATLEAGVLDLKDPEKFVAMARDFRFVENPNKPPPKVVRGDGEHISMHQTAAAPPRRRKRDRFFAFLCCFRGSQTVD